MQGSENADIWRFERDQYRKQLAEAQVRIRQLEQALEDEYMRGYHVGVKDGFSQ